jgi:hypothetical protein
LKCFLEHGEFVLVGRRDGEPSVRDVKEGLPRPGISSELLALVECGRRIQTVSIPLIEIRKRKEIASYS